MVALGLCRAQSQEGKCRDDLSLTCLSCEDSEEACCCRCPSAAWHQTLRSPACIYPHTHKVADLRPNSRLSVHGLHSRLWQELPDRDRHVGAKNGSLAQKCTKKAKTQSMRRTPAGGGGRCAASAVQVLEGGGWHCWQLALTVTVPRRCQRTVRLQVLSSQEFWQSQLLTGLFL